MLTNKIRRGASAGFTLAELLVASTLVAIVMGAVYTTFVSASQVWRFSETNLHAYHGARTAMAVMRNDLQSAMAGAGHLMDGDRRSLEFYAVVRPMNPELGREPRIMWIRYRVRRGVGGDGVRLYREEAEVRGQLPLVTSDDDGGAIRRGRTESFELTDGLKGFEFRYLWVRDPGDQMSAMVREDRHPKGRGLPQGVMISMKVDDPASDTGETLFNSIVALRGAPSHR